MRRISCLSVLFWLYFMVLPAKVSSERTIVDSTVVGDENVMRERIDSLENVFNQLDTQSKQKEEATLLSKKWKRKKYRSISFVKQSLKEMNESHLKWKSDFGVGITMGRTYYLHRKPLLGLIKFGIDWTYFDVNYAKYSNPEYVVAPFDEEVGFPPILEEEQSYSEFDLGCHQLELGMQVGPSITVNPIDHLMVNAYFRYAPSASGIIINEEASVNYASFFVSGGSISYKLISLGVEARWGKAKYKNFAFEESEDFEGDSFEDVVSESKKKYKTSSVRFFVSFRF